MLKVIQLFGCSSGSVSNFFKPFSGGGLSFVSISTLSFSYSSSTSRSSPASFSPAISSPKCRSVRIFCGSSARSESISDSASSSSSGPAQPASSAVVQSAVSSPLLGNVRNVNFCQWCGGPAKHSIPDGEEKLRAICTVCGKITYQNPKMVVGCLIEHDNKILLCKRKIQPSYGLWTLPAGYLEIGESAVEGAIRETWEEACAEVQVLSPFAQLDIPLIGQTYIIFLAKLKNPHFSPGPESSECRLFSLDNIPFDSLAFSSMLVTLTLYIEDVKTGRIKFHYGTINKRPGTSPSDIHAYTLDYHLLS